MNWSSATLSAISPSGDVALDAAVRSQSPCGRSRSYIGSTTRCPCMMRRQLLLSAAGVVDAGRQPRRGVMEYLIAATPHAHGARRSSRIPADFAGLDEQLAVVKVRTISQPESDLDSARAAM